jgi:hypothetical protein
MYREVSLKSLHKRAYAGEVEEATQRRPSDPVTGYTGYMPGVQTAIAVSYPSQAKMSHSYCEDLQSTSRLRVTASPAVTRNYAPAASSVPRAQQGRGHASLSPSAKPTTGYTGFKPGQRDLYGLGPR